MLKTLKIENFRGFPAFTLQQLGQLNLLVGENNSGKTSILEAVQLLTSPSHLESLGELMISRGEYITYDKRRNIFDLDIRHLFHGHKIDVGSRFSISGDNHDGGSRIFVSIESDDKHKYIHGEKQNDIAFRFQLSPRLGYEFNPLITVLTESAVRTQFVKPSSLTVEKMVELFDQMILTPEEDIVIQALQIIEPNINRIATIKSNKYNYPDSRNGFVVRLANESQRVPIGSMGDGIWRILGLTLAIVSARNGFLLVDEIDTGLHFTTMSDMWKLIWKTAQRLNVQVFATTHSSDCWTSLAEIANVDSQSEEGITIQRIEKDKQNSIIFTEPEIVIAAEQEIEVR